MARKSKTKSPGKSSSRGKPHPTRSSPPTPAAPAPRPSPAAKASSGSRKVGSPGDPHVRGEAPARSQAVMTLSHDEIARKAYEIWVAKGRPLGQDARNWAEAEVALRGTSA